MADRRTLEFNGSRFEATICKYLISKYPEASILTDVHVFSDFLQKETQIDLIMIHPRGVFVIEAKGWRKWVKGDYSDKMWSGQSSSMDVMTVYSPLHQNVIHIRALRNAIRKSLRVNPVTFHNIVCFPDGTDLQTNCSEVTNLSLLSMAIDKKILNRDYEIDPKVYRDLIKEVSL
jgi:hypothetical protein